MPALKTLTEVFYYNHKSEYDLLTDVLPKLSIVKNLFNRPLRSQQCHPKYSPQIVSGPNRNSEAPWGPNTDPMQ